MDDTTITGSSTSLNKEFKCISQRFKIIDLGSISWLLGLAIERDRTARYIETILHRFNLEAAKSLKIPMDPNTHLSKEDCPSTKEEEAAMKKIPYREAIGALNWIAVGSRHIVAFGPILYAMNSMPLPPSHMSL